MIFFTAEYTARFSATSYFFATYITSGLMQATKRYAVLFTFMQFMHFEFRQPTGDHGG